MQFCCHGGKQGECLPIPLSILTGGLTVFVRGGKTTQSYLLVNLKQFCLESILLGQKQCPQNLGMIHSHTAAGRRWLVKCQDLGLSEDSNLKDIFPITLAEVAVSLFGFWALVCDWVVATGSILAKLVWNFISLNFILLTKRLGRRSLFLGRLIKLLANWLQLNFECLADFSVHKLLLHSYFLFEGMRFGSLGAKVGT